MLTLFESVYNNTNNQINSQHVHLIMHTRQMLKATQSSNEKFLISINVGGICIEEVSHTNTHKSLHGASSKSKDRKGIALHECKDKIKHRLWLWHSAKSVKRKRKCNCTHLTLMKWHNFQIRIKFIYKLSRMLRDDVDRVVYDVIFSLLRFNLLDLSYDALRLERSTEASWHGIF